MRTPKRGDAYQLCMHSADQAAMAELHYWRLPKRRWLVLCAACHVSYSKRTPVHVESVMRLYLTAQDLGGATVHVAPRNPTRCVLVPSRPPPPSPIEQDRTTLWFSAQEVMASMCLPSRRWSPREVRMRLRSLRLSYQKQQRWREAAGSVGPTAASQLAEIDCALKHMEARLLLVTTTRKRVAALLRQSQRLLARALDKPLAGYFYRRRVYRRLLRERDTLASLIWLLNVPESYWPTDWVSRLQDTFRDLRNRYGMPLSDAAMRRLVSQTPLADIAALGTALAHCQCRACMYFRHNTPLDAEQEEEVIATCPCALCKFTRTTMPKIDLSKVDKAPDFRDALLTLRRRVGGSSSFN